MNIFTDHEAAIEEAEFLARETGKDHAIFALDETSLRVDPLTKACGARIIEIFRADHKRSHAQCAE